MLSHRTVHARGGVLAGMPEDSPVALADAGPSQGHREIPARAVELSSPRASNSPMRRHTFHVMLLLLAWSVGFQPVAEAMGGRCAQSGAAGMSMQDAAPSNPHAMHSMSDVSGHEGHTRHVSSGEAPVDDMKMGGHGCQCGCSCAMPGCLGAAPGIAAVSSVRTFGDPDSKVVTLEVAAELRAAHGLDLIRPPSKS